MPYSSGSFFTRDTNNSTTTYAKADDHASYKYYNNITWSMWLALQPGINKNIWSMWEDVATNNRAWLFSTQDDGSFRLIFSANGTGVSSNHKTSTPIFNFGWVHVVVTFASGVFAVKVNDVAKSLTETTAWTAGAVPLHSAGQRLLVGAKNPAAPGIDQAPGGCYSNFSMWNKVLSASEITELYNLGRPGDLTTHSAYANLTNHWRMDQTDTAPNLADSRAGAGAKMVISKTGTNPYFDPSTSYPTYGLDPGIANVRNGTAYVINGDNKTGTLVVPSLSDTKTGVAGDGGTGTYDGSDRWTDPGVTHVRSGQTYKANSTSNNRTGTAVIPGLSDTKVGVAGDGGTGTYDGSDRWTDPGVGNVKVGETYKANSTSNNRTGTAVVNTADDVKDGVEAYDGTGTYRGQDLWEAVPADELKLGESYLQDGDEVVGTYQNQPADLREALNRVLVFVGATTLTDDEYDSLTIDEFSTMQQSYEALLAILQAREAISTVADRLRYYYLAKAVQLEEAPDPGEPESKILIGESLDQDFTAVEGESNVFIGGDLD